MRRPKCEACGRPLPVKPDPALVAETDGWWLGIVLLLSAVVAAEGIWLWILLLR